MPDSGKGYRILLGLGGVRMETVAYNVLSLLSIVSILAAFSNKRLKRALQADALSRRLVTMCGFSLLYEYKFRLGQQISHLRFVRDYGYTLVAISQLAHFVALTAAAVDAIFWRVSRRRARLRHRPRAVRFASWTAWTVVTLSSVAVVCYVQLYRREKTKIFLPKQAAELASVPFALLFFVAVVFWRPVAVDSENTTTTTTTTTTRRSDGAAAEAITYVYIRMMLVTFATNCSRIILIMVKTEWWIVRFIHALDGCFFALIAYKLEPIGLEVADASADDADTEAAVIGETSVHHLKPVNSCSAAAGLQQV